MKKKIAIFNDFQLPVPAVRGGAVQQLTTSLLDCNETDYRYDFEVYTPYDEKAVEASKKYKHTVFHFSKQAKYIRFYTNVCHKLKLPADLSSMPLPPDVIGIFKKTQYDAIYVSGYIRGVLTIAKINDGRCPVYYHHHVITDIMKETSIRGKEIFESCRKIGFVSQYGCDNARTGIEKYDEKITLFRNCIDVRKFQNTDKEFCRTKIRSEFGIDNNDILIVFVGRFVSNKGVLQLLKAFNLCSKENPNLKLMLIGGATYSSNSKTEYIEQCMKEIGTNCDNVILTGYIPNAKLQDYLSASDIGCVPSVYEEACGLTALEMMASGLPIITTDAAGLGEYVVQGCKEISKWQKGLKPDDIIPGLANAIRKLADNKCKREEYSKMAAESVWRYDVQSYLKEFCRFIEE